MLEKLCSGIVGVIFSCLFVRLVSSRATSNPRAVTSSADNLRVVGMVIIGVFAGKKLEVISSPVRILPQASRLIGLITVGVFSLRGDKGRNRGAPMEAKKITRKLYTAVKEVAMRVRVRAQAFRCDVFRASMMASFEKNPERNGIPVKARLPMVRQVEVRGSMVWRPPIFRMSCSSLRLWIIDPEHRNNIALKNAWVQMCRKANWGWFKPMVTIIRPSWLDVENATIFLMSFCVRAQAAVNRVVVAPRQRQVVRATWLCSIRGWSRMSRKMPATTMVLECSRAETGVGPSIAEGSQG